MAKKKKKPRKGNGKVVPIRKAKQSEVKRDEHWIHIAIPTMRNKIGLPLQNMLTVAQLLTADPEQPYKFTWEIVNDKWPVHYARNVLAGTFLGKTQADILWYVDTDMIPPKEFMKLLDVDADIIVPQMVNFNHRRPGKLEGLKLCAFDFNKRKQEFRPLIPERGDTIIPCVGAGTGSMVLRRKVLEDPRMHLDPYYRALNGKMKSLMSDAADQTWAPAIFRLVSKSNGEVLRGEDLDFTLRAHTLGYKIRAHLGVRFGHYKPIDLNQAISLMNRVAESVRRDEKEKYDAAKTQMEDSAQPATA